MNKLASCDNESKTIFDQSDASSQFFVRFAFCAWAFSTAIFNQSDASSQFFV